MKPILAKPYADQPVSGWLLSVLMSDAVENICRAAIAKATGEAA